MVYNNETIQQLNNEVAMVVQQNTVPEVKTMEEYKKVGDVVKVLKNKYKEVEDKRKELTKPILDSKRKLDAEFKKTLDPLKKLITLATANQKTFYIAEQARRDKEQAKIDAEAQANGEDEVEVVNDIVKSTGDISSTTVSKKKAFRIVDISTIPREFLMIDEKKIKEYMKTNFNNPPEGIEFYEDINLRHN